MMVYVTGDIHGEIGFDKLEKLPANCESLIILGDFGLIFDQVETMMERHLFSILESKDITFYVVDGNHENFHRLNSYPRIKRNGGMVGKIRDNIFHLRRGNIYTIDGKTVFVMGGGLSVDKKYRTENISWWKEEEPSKQEIENAIVNLNKVGRKVDYILTHSCPASIKKYLNGHFVLSGFADTKGSSDSITEYFLDELLDVEFKVWYFGHYHTNIIIEDDDLGRFVGLYNNVIPFEWFERLIGGYSFDWLYI